MGSLAGFGPGPGPTNGGIDQAPTVTSGLADETVEVKEFLLPEPGLGSKIGQLSQAVVRVQENVRGSSEAEAGPMWAELWLQRSKTGLSMLLDKGFIRGGSVLGLHSVVGIVGKVTYFHGDILLVHAANFSGATVNYQIDALTEPFASEGSFAFTRLSTEHTSIAHMVVEYNQGNAAGGAVIVEIVPGAGNKFKLVGGILLNSGTNTLEAFLLNAAGGSTIIDLGAVASAASSSLSLPLVPAAAAVTQTSGTKGSSLGLEVSALQALRVSQGAAGAQTDKFRIRMSIEVIGRPPSVSKANSTNEADVTVTAGAARFTVI